MAAIIVALLLSTQTPCDGPPSEQCEQALIEAANTWELRYTEANAAHRHLLSTCTDVLFEQTPVEPPTSHIIAPWIYVLLGVGGFAAGVFTTIIVVTR